MDSDDYIDIICGLKYNEAYFLILLQEMSKTFLSSEIFRATKDKSIYYRANTMKIYENFIDRYYNFPGTTTALFCVEDKYILFFKCNHSKDDSFIKRERTHLINKTKDDVYYYKHKRLYDNICNFIDLHPKMWCDWCNNDPEYLEPFNLKNLKNK